MYMNMYVYTCDIHGTFPFVFLSKRRLRALLAFFLHENIGFGGTYRYFHCEIIRFGVNFLNGQGGVLDKDTNKKLSYIHIYIYIYIHIYIYICKRNYCSCAKFFFSFSFFKASHSLRVVEV